MYVLFWMVSEIELFHCIVVSTWRPVLSFPPAIMRHWSMWIGVKCQLVIVTVDSDIVGMLWKLMHIFTNVEYADMLYVYGFWDVCAMASVEEYCDGFLCAEFWIVEYFPRCSIHCVNVARFPVLMFHLNEHVNNVWRNRETFLKWYSIALLLACEDFLHVSVFHEYVYGEHCMWWLAPMSPTAYAKSTPKKQCHVSRMLSLVTY
jgi:hypothetical protein